MKRCGLPRTALTFSALASSSLLQLGCVPDCPPGMTAEYDQCVRKGVTHADAASGGGAAEVDGPSNSGGGPASGGTSSVGTGGAESEGSGGNGIPDGGAPDGDASTPPPCETGKVFSTDSCIPERLFVNAESGNDANDGGPAHPLKTFRAAMQKVRPKQRVQFESGVWGVGTTDDDFADLIPDDVVLESSARGQPYYFNGGGKASLAFAGGAAELRDVVIQGFQKPLAASSGSPLAVNITIRGSQGSVWISGTARLRCVACVFEEDTSKVMSIVRVTDAAHLELQNAHFYRFAYATAGIDVQDSASLLVEGCNFGGGLQNVIYAATSGSITLRDSFFSTRLYEVFASGNLDGPLSRLDIEGCTFRGGVQLGAPIERIRIRNSKMALLGIGGSDQVADLGMPGDAGVNEFVRDQEVSAPYLWVTGWGHVVHAAGNKWPENQQGTDPDGRYPTPTIIRQGESGPNVEVRVLEMDGGGRAPSRVEL